MAVPRPLRSRLAALVLPRFTIGVSAILLNDGDEILFLRHRFRESHAWALPGGFVRRGEDLENALARELREELGRQIDPPVLISTHISGEFHIDVLYVARIRTGPLALDYTEVLDARFWALTELPEDLTIEQKEQIRLAFEHAPDR